ncbi:hypothetical protein [Acidithiobacillus sp.]|uniref:hypothetical protein n=1 Tax=Acidithiobacillus sp. TaxID=1872118 RepID=UPI003D035D80
MIHPNDRRVELESHPAVLRLLTRLFPEVDGKDIRQSTLDEDRNQGADWFVGSAKIAVRVRSAFYSRYFGDFTIRECRPTGYKTELEKIRENAWADYYFYGFWRPDVHTNGCMFGWYFTDMRRFNPNAPHTIMPGDHEATVRIYKITGQPPDFVIATRRLDGSVFIQYPTQRTAA